MSARDSASPAGPGNSGAGGLGNGGLGGGMGGGLGGGGWGGGMSGNTGLGTGNTWYGNTAFGTPGMMASGYAMRDPSSLNAAGMGPMNGQFGQYKTLNGNPMFSGLGNPMASVNAPNAVAGAGLLQQLQQANVHPLIGKILSGLQPPVQQPTVQPASFPVAPAQPPLTKLNFPAFFGGPRKGITDRVPQDPTFNGNTFDNITGRVGYGKDPSRVNGYNQSGDSYYGR